MTTKTPTGTPSSQRDNNGQEASTFIVETDPAPLYVDQDGVVRVIGTRVLVELVVGAFERGAKPEEIVESYSTLQLADVYAVIAYYLRHQDAVKDYIQRSNEEAEEIRRTIEAYQNSAEFRERLKVQRAARGA